MHYKIYTHSFRFKKATSVPIHMFSYSFINNPNYPKFIFDGSYSYGTPRVLHVGPYITVTYSHAKMVNK